MLSILRATLACCLLAPALFSPSIALSADAPRLFSDYRGQRVYGLPFPRSERAQSVWQSGACWSECGAHCAWSQSACLRVDSQGRCIAWTDACDRYCQRICRTLGGPLLNITD
ncbi:MAG: hypothetical protein ACR2K5_02095 [Pseudolabrys sp.]